jgi:xylulose-5-phosphate/fructose-6-phosphate phosphoketolase
MQGLGAQIDVMKKRVRAADYLSVAQMYLQDNFLLNRPLASSDIKPRLLGHWGTCHGINVFYTHIKMRYPDTQFVIGPGHGFAALQANLFIDGDLEKVDISATRNLAGMEYVCKNFSWPGGFPSHSSPFTPGVILEGGELGYCLGTAYGAALNQPGKLVACLIGDGELETGSLLASLNLHQLVGTQRNGTVLPILHLNGYKISAPSIYARRSERGLMQMLRGFGYDPVMVDGEDYEEFQRVLDDVRPGKFIIMRTQKGYGGPRDFKGEKVAGNYLSHQVPLGSAKKDPEEMQMLEEWMKSYRFEELYPDLPALAVETPDDIIRGKKIDVTNGQNLPVDLPHSVDNPGQEFYSPAKVIGKLLRDELVNDENFRFFSPDETTSNKLDAVFEASDRAWNLSIRPWDKYLSPDGRNIDVLSENALFAMMSGYVLSGRSGMLASYEAFLPIITSQIEQHMKFVDQARQIDWRPRTSAINLLSTSTCWRQDHNGFSHQNPGLISALLSKPSNLVNCLFPVDDVAAAVAFDFMAKAKDVVNLMTFNKTIEPRWIDKNHAEYQLANGGASMFGFASDENPEIVLAAAGDIVTREALYAMRILKQDLPELRMRFVGVGALSYNAIGTTENKLTTAEFEYLFTKDKPVVANFHGYPDTLAHILHQYGGPGRFRVHGYIERGSTTSPLEMLRLNRASRYDLAIKVAEILGRLDLVQKYQSMLDNNAHYARTFGVDLPEVVDFRF